MIVNIPLDDGTLIELGRDAVAIAVLIVVVFIIFAVMLYRVSSSKPALALVSAVALMAFAALVAYVLTREEALATIASAAVGGLVGSLTATFGNDKNDGEGDDDG